MKKMLLSTVLVSVVVSSVAFGTDNTELIDKLQEVQPVALSAQDLEFTSFASCDDMSATLTQFVKDNFDLWHGPMPYWRGGGMVDDLAVAEESANAAG